MKIALILFTVFAVVSSEKVHSFDLNNCPEEVCKRSEEINLQCVKLDNKLDLLLNPRTVECAGICKHDVKVVDMDQCEDLINELDKKLQDWKQLTSQEFYEKAAKIVSK